MVDATHIHGVEVQIPNFNGVPMPSGDAAWGRVASLNPDTGKIEWRQPHLAIGPSSLLSNVGIPGRRWTTLWHGIDQDGFRSGLVAYIPRGVWQLWGTIVVAGPGSTAYDIRVMQAHDLSPDPNRVNFVTENRQQVGAGCGVGSAPDHLPAAIPFCAHMIQFFGDEPQACEISVDVYAKYDGNSAAALASVTPDAQGGGGVPNAWCSTFTIMRIR